ncbi:MAG TPA: helix-turn-helix domain-containing protein [Ilumatobacteraceae bacterium]|nr:helix-turn-helix domain-containing protein [Ilumatobacteraceae bacterium]
MRAARRAWMADEELSLAPKEFDLLVLLATHHGQTLRRETIMTEVWDENWWGSTRTLDTHVAALRRKLGDTNDTPERIITIRGIGFRYDSD